MRLPSIKTLSAVFGDNAKNARVILEMTRSELMELPACQARLNECYYPPKTWDLRLTALDAICDGSCGVESFETERGWCEFLNTGDTYSPTLLRFNGQYRVACWGDIAERYAS